MIEVSNLVKNFNSFPALKGISFSVSKGEILGLLGPNGAGKTTTLKILTCLLPFTSGTVLIHGLSPQKDSLKIRKLVGVLSEGNPLYPELRVREFLKFRADLKQIPRRQIEDRIQTVLQQCQLKEVEQRIIGTLSKGFCQRVGLADALIHDPQILILDEPTIGLDPHQVRQLRQLIRDLAQNRTVIFSSHILSEVEALCSKVVILNQGEKIVEGVPQKIISQHSNHQIQMEVKASKEAIEFACSVLSNIKHVSVESHQDESWCRVDLEVEQGVDLREELFYLIHQKGWSLRELKTTSHSLEDIFVRLTEKEVAPA